MLGLKNLAMLSSYLNDYRYVFVHLKQKARLRPDLSSKFLSTLARTQPEKPGPTYNSEAQSQVWPILMS